MSEEELIRTRLSKHEEANSGTYPLASSAGTEISSLLSQFTENTPVSIQPDDLGNTFVTRGRIQTFRKGGSIAFVTMYDSTGSIQLIISKAACQDFQSIRLMDLGDIIEVEGKLCFSKTNEKSLLLLNWRLLTKSHRPMPEKFAGISDTEIKYRQRYLDLLSSEQSRAVFVVRSYALRGIRDYMEREGFLEVETSTLNTISSGANAKPFTTHHNALDMDLFLRIAPELYLKRLLVGGMDKVFEIGRNYRNEGLSTRHNPEFTMMEFYEAYGNFPKLIERTSHMLAHVEMYLENNLPKNILPIYLPWKESRTFAFSNAVQVTMLQAVHNAAEKLGVKLHITKSGVSYEQLSHHVDRKIDIEEMWAEVAKSKSMGQVICTFFEYMAEPFLTQDYRTADGKYSVPVFITEYPKDICPLARAKDSNSSFCDRFELFVDGRELCNAFQELNDPSEQELRFKEQLADNSKDPMDFDADYVTALQYGMPPAIGFGIGLDRLFMLLTNAASIRDVILFPTMKSIQ